MSIERIKVKLRFINDALEYCSEINIKKIIIILERNSQSIKVSNLSGNSNESNLIEVKIPKSYKEAIKTPKVSEWEESMN